MADEDGSFPPEIQKSPAEFLFKELSHLKVINSSEQPSYPTIRSNLLAVANIYGFVFVGLPDGVKVYSSSKLLEAGKMEKGEIDEVVATISLRNSPNWIAVSSNNLTLCVCCGPQMLLFDVRNIANKSKVAKTPFCSFALSKNPTAVVTSLSWNPSLDWPYLLAVCMSTGSFHMLAVQNTVTEIGIRPDNFGAATVCWSPKGKQMVVGKTDGTLHQLTPKLEVKKSVSVATVIDRPVRTCDILWLSTFQFAAAYIATDTEDDNFSQPNLFLAHLPSKNENRDVIWRNYEDPCFGMNETQQPRFMMSFIDQWEMFITLSSNSTDSTVIAKNRDSQIWEIWTLDDSCRAGLPISPFTDDDSAPLGVALITTATDRIIVDDTRECGPMPVLLILTNDGVLCPFHTISLTDNYPDIITEAQQLDLTEERIASAARGPSVGDGDLKPGASSKQKLTAKPSILATSTPKPGSSLFGSKSDITLGADQPKPSFSASTPFAKLPPFAAVEEASIIQSTPGPQLKPPLTRELPLKTSPFSKVKQQALDESTDSVFGSQRTGSSESVFNPSNPPQAPIQPPLPEPQTVPRKVPLGPTKSIFPSSVPSFSLPRTTPSGGSIAPPGESTFTEVTTLTDGSTITGGPPSDPGFRKPPLYPEASKQRENIESTAAAPPYRGPRAGPAETGTFAKKRETTSVKQPLTRKDSRGSPTVGDNVTEPLRRKGSRGSSAPSPSAGSPSSTSAETMEEIFMFEKELNELISSSQDVDSVSEKLGNNEEKAELKKEVDSLCTFSTEISRTTKELHNEIRDTSTVLMESLSTAEDSLRKQKMGKDASYRTMLYSRPLDPTNQKKMKGIRGLYEYIQGCVREANTALDLQWEKMQEKRKKIPGGRKRGFQMGEWETAYQALVKNMSILHEQEIKLTLLGQELDKLKLFDTTAHTHTRRPLLPSRDQPSSKSTDLQLLADTLLLKRDQSPSVGAEFQDADQNQVGERRKSSGTPTGRKLSPKKQAQLGQMLANRKVTPVRTSGAGSPSYVTKPTIRGRGSKGSPLVGTPDADTQSEMRNFDRNKEDMKYATEFGWNADEVEERQESSPSPTTTGSSSSLSDIEKSDHEILKEDRSSPLLQQVNPFPEGTPAVNNLKPQRLSFATPLQGGDVRPSFPSNKDAFTPPKSGFPPTSTPASIIPQGSATLAYGAPKSVASTNKTRDLSSMTVAYSGEAASNLNNPPQVVNIQQMQNPTLQELSLPEKFEAKPEVPAGAVEVMQKVLYSAQVEKQQQQKEWNEKLGQEQSMEKKPGIFSSPTPKSILGLQPNPSTPVFGSFGKPSSEPGGPKVFGSPGAAFGFSLGDGPPQSGASTENRTPPVFGGGSALGTGVNYQFKPPPTTAESQRTPVTPQPFTPPTTKSTGGAVTSTLDTKPAENKPSVFGSLLQKSASFAGFTQKTPDIFATSGTDKIKTSGLFQVVSSKPIISTSAQPTITIAGQAASASQVVSAATSGGSIFGALTSSTASPKSNSSSGGIFGTLSSGNVFGGTSSIFGAVTTTSGSVSSSTTPSSGGVFITVTSSSTGGVFGLSTATTSSTTGDDKSSTIAPSSGLFATSTNSSSSGPFATSTVAAPSSGGLFGTNAASAPSSEGLFGTASTSAPSSGVFGSSTALASSSGGLFGTTSTSAPSNVGVFGAIATSSSSGGGLFGTPSTSAPSSGVFGSSTTSASSSGGLFGTASTSAPPGGVFGSSTTSAPSGGGVFGAIATSAPPGGGLFGTASTSAPSGGGLFGTTSTSAPSGGGLFGTPSTSVPSGGGLFGTPSTSAPSGGGLFGTPSTSVPSGGSVFGSSTGMFGANSSTTSTGSVFGQGTTSSTGGVFGSTTAPSTGGFGGNQTQSSGFSFASGQTAFDTPSSQSAFGASSTSAFGQKPAFGQTAGFGAAQPSSGFGTNAATTSQSNVFGSGFFSGLGGKPSDDAANKNPFAVGDDAQQQNTSGFGSSMFGNTGAKTFGTSAFGQSPQQKPSGFGEITSSGVGSQGFGGFNKQQQSGGFGSAPAFGSAATFGSPPSFGSAAGRSFGSGFGSAAAPSGGGFGQAANEGSGFASFAKSETPGFGNLAQQTGGGFGGFGAQQQQQQQQQQPQQQSGFGFPSNAPKSPSFSGWR